jgi:hypothetical protein
MFLSSEVNARRICGSGYKYRGRTTPFRGFVDMTSEMNRMRQLGMYGYEPWQEDWERT